MNSTALVDVAKWFGPKFDQEAARTKSYGLIEALVTATPTDKNAANTEAGLKLLKAELGSLDDQAFAFLLVHSGFIPDHYGDDSSEETLYSKFMEAMVAEWASRLGHTVTLPTAKSSTEDVTIFNGDEVIVSDAKSFRLGRSQGAPNTKDAVKPEDYYKWLGRHTTKKPVGGLIAFPSKFDWQRGSDVYLYVSNSQDGKRITLLFYEHLTYLLLKKSALKDNGVFGLLKRYGELFKSATKNRDVYWIAIDEALQTITGAKDLKDF